jgi:hypothetical protein
LTVEWKEVLLRLKAFRAEPGSCLIGMDSGTFLPLKLIDVGERKGRAEGKLIEKLQILGAFPCT